MNYAIKYDATVVDHDRKKTIPISKNFAPILGPLIYNTVHNLS